MQLTTLGGCRCYHLHQVFLLENIGIPNACKGKVIYALPQLQNSLGKKTARKRDSYTLLMTTNENTSVMNMWHASSK